MAEHEERRKAMKKEKEQLTGALDVSASDVWREDFDKGRNRQEERSAKKSRGFFLRHGMLLRENIRRQMKKRGRKERRSGDRSRQKETLKRREEGYNNANWGEAKKRITEKKNGAGEGSKIKKERKIEKNE